MLSRQLLRHTVSCGAFSHYKTHVWDTSPSAAELDYYDRLYRSSRIMAFDLEWDRDDTVSNNPPGLLSIGFWPAREIFLMKTSVYSPPTPILRVLGEGMKRTSTPLIVGWRAERDVRKLAHLRVVHETVKTLCYDPAAAVDVHYRAKLPIGLWAAAELLGVSDLPDKAAFLDVRTSWSSKLPLTPEQTYYAAADVYATIESFRLYRAMAADAAGGSSPPPLDPVTLVPRPSITDGALVHRVLAADAVCDEDDLFPRPAAADAYDGGVDEILAAARAAQAPQSPRQAAAARKDTKGRRRGA